MRAKRFMEYRTSKYAQCIPLSLMVERNRIRNKRFRIVLRIELTEKIYLSNKPNYDPLLNFDD